MSPAALCVFAKPPRAGEAKTRLAPVLGAAGAAALARAMFLDVWAAVTALPWADVILATTDVDAPEWDGIDRRAIWPQGPGTLGDRMERVLARALRMHSCAIAIGADLPGLPAERLEAARDALSRADAVLGPTEDGGFCLIGVRRLPAGALANLPWSSAETYASTAARLQALGLSVRALAPWFDVDDPADLERLQRLVRQGQLNAPETRRVLHGS